MIRRIVSIARRPLAQDLAIVIVLAAIQVALLPAVAHRDLIAPFLVLEPVPLLLRRRAPLLTMALIGLADVILALAGTPLQSLGASIVVAAYSAGAHQARRPSLVTLGVGVVALIVLVLVTSEQTGNVDRLSAALVVVAAWWIGTTLRERRTYAAELERQAEQLRAARTELAVQAVAAERLRLARELHDVVAHSLAIVALHSSVGAHNAQERPQDAARALAAVNTATRSALAELRALLTVLRADDAAGRLPHQSTVDEPLPGLADLSTLVAQAPPGVSISLTRDGPWEELPLAVSLNAYRIVQEALTNVVKHAAPTRATVVTTVDDRKVRVQVTNEPGARPPTRGEGGAGLVGMRERVAAFGGELEVGPTAAGGWSVVATLPYNTLPYNTLPYGEP